MSTLPRSFEEELLLTDDYGDIALARRFTSDVLTRLGFAGSHETAVLVVSELVANALRHGRGGGRLRLSGDGRDRLRVEVSDRSRPRGEMRPGWGLTLVDSMSDGWGVVPRDDGKMVWCELGVDSDRLGRVKLQYDHRAADVVEAARR